MTTRLIRRGLLDEFEEKKSDVRKRLAKNFTCFTKINKVSYLISGGDESATMLSNTNCVVTILGGSSGDTDEGMRIVRRVVSGFSSMFSGRDVHSMIVRDSLSQIMKLDLEDKDNARGLAVEFVIVDFTGRLTLVYFTGDQHTVTDDEMNDKMFFAGCYDNCYRKRVSSAISDLFKDMEKPNEEKMKKIQAQLFKRLKIEHCNIVVLENVTPKIKKDKAKRVKKSDQS